MGFSPCTNMRGNPQRPMTSSHARRERSQILCKAIVTRLRVYIPLLRKTNPMVIWITQSQPTSPNPCPPCAFTHRPNRAKRTQFQSRHFVYRCHKPTQNRSILPEENAKPAHSHSEIMQNIEVEHTLSSIEILKYAKQTQSCKDSWRCKHVSCVQSQPVPPRQRDTKQSQCRRSASGGSKRAI
jgi:hypothetical protein